MLRVAIAVPGDADPLDRVLAEALLSLSDDQSEIDLHERLLTTRLPLPPARRVAVAAAGEVAVALIRGLVRKRSNTLGNFWVDLVRTCTRILLPLSFGVNGGSIGSPVTGFDPGRGWGPSSMNGSLGKASAAG